VQSCARCSVSRLSPVECESRSRRAFAHSQSVRAAGEDHVQVACRRAIVVLVCIAWV